MSAVRSGAAPQRVASIGAEQCPLSSSQKRKAVDAFKELMPAITHPRCINCHGAVDVFDASAEVTHGGRRISPKASGDCDACHDYDETEGGKESPWRLPPTGLNFVGRTQTQICTQMQQFASGSGDQIIAHVSGDPLLGAGFEGRRGQSDLKPEPPPMDRATFVAKTRAWLHVINGVPDLPGSPGCGCSPGGGYRVTFESHAHSEKRGLKDDRRYVAELYPDPSEPGDLKGEGRYSALLNSKNANCTNDDKNGGNEHWYNIQGKLDASGSVSEVPSDVSAPANGTKPSRGKAPREEYLSFMLATTDWPLVPLGGYATDDETKEMVKGAGVAGLPLIKLTGATTTWHKEIVIGSSECDGKMTMTMDYTIQALP